MKDARLIAQVELHYILESSFLERYAKNIQTPIATYQKVKIVYFAKMGLHLINEDTITYSHSSDV